MREKKLQIIVTTMTFALIGLLAIQFYWIKNAIDVESERFDRNISESLSNVVDAISKKEAANYVFKFLDGDTVYYSSDSVCLPYDSIRFLTKNSLSTTDSLLFISNIDSLKPKPGRKIVQTKVIDKDNIVREVVNELIYKASNIPLKKRIKVEFVSEILNTEFYNKGYNFDFNFNIIDAKKDTLLYICAEEDIASLLNSKHKTQLFPDELLSDPYYLVVNIPDQKSIVIKSIAAVLILSLVFLVSIIIIFYQTIKLLLKQKKISEIKNDFINNITHEFKTPISTISLAADNIIEPGLIKHPGTLQKYSKIIKDENNRLQHMVDTLLNTAVFEKDEYILEKIDINVNKIIDKVINKYRIIIEQKEAEIITNYDACNPLLRGDAFHLENIISNILDNALKYCKVNPIIRVTTKKYSSSISISIEDNGVGIDKKQLNKIFDTFYRVPTGNLHEVKGYGIGLSYAKKMVEALGGRITVISKLNNGSKFQIFFPSIK